MLGRVSLEVLGDRYQIVHAGDSGFRKFHYKADQHGREHKPDEAVEKLTCKGIRQNLNGGIHISYRVDRPGQRAIAISN